MKESNPFLSIIICVVLIFTACQSNKFDNEILIGSWEVLEWKIEETGKSVNNKLDMKFESGKSYSIDYGSKNEKGKYWIAGDFLHTVEKEQTEKKVKILKLVADTMEIQMNRAGHLESVILIKKKNQ
jgi:hypothetical protein